MPDAKPSALATKFVELCSTATVRSPHRCPSWRYPFHQRPDCGAMWAMRKLSICEDCEGLGKKIALVNITHLWLD